MSAASTSRSRRSGTRSLSSSNQQLFLRTSQSLDRQFTFQSQAASCLRLLVGQDNGQAAACVARCGSSVVLVASTDQIVGDPRVKRVVGTPQNVDEPISHFSPRGGPRRKGNFSFQSRREMALLARVAEARIQSRNETTPERNPGVVWRAWDQPDCEPISGDEGNHIPIWKRSAGHSKKLRSDWNQNFSTKLAPGFSTTF